MCVCVCVSCFGCRLAEDNGLGRSLFERFADKCEREGVKKDGSGCFIQLKKQYRMVILSTPHVSNDCSLVRMLLQFRGVHVPAKNMASVALISGNVYGVNVNDVRAVSEDGFEVI